VTITFRAYDMFDPFAAAQLVPGLTAGSGSGELGQELGGLAVVVEITRKANSVGPARSISFSTQAARVLPGFFNQSRRRLKYSI